MFETLPTHQLLSECDALQAWKIVLLNHPCRWFFVTASDYDADGKHLRTRMMLIADPLIFQQLIHLKSRTTRYGTVYLVMPIGEPGALDMGWDFSRLVAMKEFDPGNGDVPAYAYLTAEGAWEDARLEAMQRVEGRLVYKSPDYEEVSEASEVSDDFIASLAKEVFSMACELHGGDMRAAAAWLQTPLPAIGNLAPIDIKESDLPRLRNAIGKRIRDIIS
ncbi:antitoxin Xre/MbcA/ParS toxin-binding domain-containing protein [Pseudomonas asiatica]|uniref:MbcA/ParS/Xre antitoxin family protein n=1 Tax=Pseudomonas asiatica TaxID=2219225 RepID=A0A9X4D5W7_9PSED|nr:antitoxin Xre/MbcA/ParS toxin-binding domain-containing protein [Pseudomonas asiatica]MDD2108328.1 MbcA/ParS/Xre antitoxin family protein [Pseudomonas asiatica]